MEDFWREKDIQDDFLAMMFACCHPQLSPDQQVALILKTLCGFSTKEIARAFLSKEDTISKRLYRTKEFFRQQKIRPAVPPASELSTRQNSVLSAIYLIFNEGWHSTHHDEAIRVDLIQQAMSLGLSLLSDTRTQSPATYALMALICLHRARLDSRRSPGGELLGLEDQDRSLVDAQWRTEGQRFLSQSAYGEQLSPYHLEAAIAFEHCRAPRYADTHWEAILGYYSIWITQTEDPVIHLHRLIAMMQARGPKEALHALEQTTLQKALAHYPVYHAFRAELEMGLGQKENALQHFQQAIRLSTSPHEKSMLEKKIQGLNGEA